MKVQIKTEILQKKLSFINHAVSSKSQLPILSNILLETQGETLILRSTDLEIGIETNCSAQVEEEGGTTVPAKLFSEIISTFPHEVITLSVKEQTLTISSKKTKTTMQTIAKDEFPRLYEQKGVVFATIATKDLHSDVSMVLFAASQDTARPALSGILLQQVAAQEGKEQGFLLVATDGYRLSMKHLPSELAIAGDSQQLLIPARVLREVVSLKEETDEITMFVSPEQNQIVFSLGETTVIGRLIEAQYPPYQKIIPGDYSLRTTFDREQLHKAVKMCSIVARDAANIIKFSLQKDKIIVSSQAASVGENIVEVEAQLTGEENEIAFNARYLLEVLGTVNVDQMTFEMTGPLNPGVFKVANDESFLHLIMPIRLQQ